MFGSNHYVPVLKLKRGEKGALQSLGPSIAIHTTPLLEIVEIPEPGKGRIRKSLELHLDTAFKGLNTVVQPFPRIFLDAREIEPHGPEGAEEAFHRAGQLGLRFTPVTGITRTADVQPAIKASKSGLALRVTRRELDDGGLAQRIGSFLSKNLLKSPRIDLILDIGCVDQLVSSGVADLVCHFIQAIPQPSTWRTFTVVGCAFPKSMGILPSNTHRLVDRSDWVAWMDDLYPRRNMLARLPTFGDCAIQRPEGVEGFKPGLMHAAAAVRYALDREWLLVKGHSTGTTSPSEQFPNLARKLVTGSLRNYFAGTEHCQGCGGADRAAQGALKLGAPETWRRLGTIHHITNTVGQIQALSWP